MREFLIYYATFGIIVFLFTSLNAKVVRRWYLEYKITTIYRRRTKGFKMMLLYGLLTLVTLPVILLCTLIHSFILTLFKIKIGEDMANLLLLPELSESELEAVISEEYDI